jgi:hypothetical protein
VSRNKLGPASADAPEAPDDASRLHRLNDGDVVTIGQHEILYIDERPTRRHG